MLDGSILPFCFLPPSGTSLSSRGVRESVAASQQPLPHPRCLPSFGPGIRCALSMHRSTPSVASFGASFGNIYLSLFEALSLAASPSVPPSLKRNSRSMIESIVSGMQSESEKSATYAAADRSKSISSRSENPSRRDVFSGNRVRRVDSSALCPRADGSRR